MSRTADRLADGVRLQNDGQPQEAEAIYRAILADDPRNADALRLMGLLALGAKNYRRGLEYMMEAIATAPGQAAYHADAAECYRALGRIDEAIAECRRALDLDPDLADAHNRLGLALMSTGQFAEAAACFRAAIASRQHHAPYHNNLGIALARANDLEPAADAYRQATVLDAENLSARLNLANLLETLGDHHGALNHLRTALKKNPNSIRAARALGTLLSRLGRHDEAIETLRAARDAQPQSVELALAHGNALAAAERLDEAVAILEAVHRLAPDNSEVAGILAGALTQMGNVEDAAKTLDAALAANPDQPDLDSVRLMVSHYRENADGASLLAAHRQWSHRHAAALAIHYAPHRNPPEPGRIINVGYVSGDFREHSVGYFIEALLVHHDRRQVRVHAYATSRRADKTTRRLRAVCDAWHDIDGLSDADAAALIRAEGIDILVDLSGHTALGRPLLFARRPAPVQIGYLGYPSTSGMVAMDYRITDAIIDPKDQPPLYVEALIRLARGAHCYTPPASAPDIAPGPASRGGTPVFGSFAHAWKIGGTAAGLWARVLSEVPEARLVLKGYGLSNEATRTRLTEAMTGAGVEASRLTFLPFTPTHADHMKAFRDIDVMLDTFPYNGTTTTCEALWMGVSVVTLTGSLPISRTGASILGQVGLDALVAADPDRYVSIAAGLARDPAACVRYRQELRPRMTASPLVDARGFAGTIEQAYRSAWQHWCAQRQAA